MSGKRLGATGRIFISYRREESAYSAGWLFDRLAERYGHAHVFKDVDSIELGDDFVEVITNAVASCDVLLALIGDKWLTMTDDKQRRALDDPNDFVRLEIEAALARRVRVIPILVDGATMPTADQLPPSLAPLARRQALELSPSRFEFDTSRLISVLDKTLAEVRAETPSAPPAARSDGPAARDWRTRPWATRRTAVALAVVAVAAAAIAAAVATIGGRTVVFEEDFSTRAAGWDDAGAAANGGHYMRGAYRIYADQRRNEGSEGSAPRKETSVYPFAPTNVRIEVDAHKVSGPADEGGYGVYCRDDADGDNGYAFQIWDRDVAIVKYFGAEPGYAALEEHFGSRAVAATGVNKIEVTCTTLGGARAVELVFRVNGREVAAYTDTNDPFLGGTVGLFVTTEEAIEAEFDNFVVSRD